MDNRGNVFRKFEVLSTQTKEITRRLLQIAPSLANLVNYKLLYKNTDTTKKLKVILKTAN